MQINIQVFLLFCLGICFGTVNMLGRHTVDRLMKVANVRLATTPSTSSFS